MPLLRQILGYCWQPGRLQLQFRPLIMFFLKFLASTVISFQVQAFIKTRHFELLTLRNPVIQFSYNFFQKKII